MPSEQLLNYLEENGVPYTVIAHPLRYTAQEIASVAHIPGNELAKTVMVKVDEELAMAVLPAPYRVNLAALRRALGAEKVTLASEYEFRRRFPECEPGAMPPFGHLFNMPVYVDSRLEDEMQIAFCAGSHTELVQICYADFYRLSRPTVLDFAWHR